MQTITIVTDNHIKLFPQDGPYLNCYEIYLVHENEPTQRVNIDSIVTTFSLTKWTSDRIISTDPEADELLRDTNIRGSKRNRRELCFSIQCGSAMGFHKKKLQNKLFENSKNWVTII